MTIYTYQKQDVWANGQISKSDPYVYEITHLPTGKKIIGSHNGSRGFRYTTCTAQMGFEVAESPQDFTREILFQSPDLDEVREKECEIIDERNAVESDQYLNMINRLHTSQKGAHSGKDHHFYGKKRPDHSQWMKENHPSKRVKKGAFKKVRGSLTDKTFNVGEKNPMFGKKDREETRKKMSASLKGRVFERKTCPHCEKEFAANAYTRYHGDKCKDKGAE